MGCMHYRYYSIRCREIRCIQFGASNLRHAIRCTGWLGAQEIRCTIWDLVHKRLGAQGIRCTIGHLVHILVCLSEIRCTERNLVHMTFDAYEIWCMAIRCMEIRCTVNSSFILGAQEILCIKIRCMEIWCMEIWCKIFSFLSANLRTLNLVYHLSIRCPRIVHSPRCLKITEKVSFNTARAKQATFTFWVDKS